ncbi:DUF6969 family protein [Glaciimonas immobilis]|uniref:DUF6969 domain-containing protein n=1 Tax=Glaciimonas immobilis TaxID=728004 RepID=A0A840RXC7_9BURK|nr:hypothetical protein [Glaciimonas immobilis]KAF3996525.1 hypothetical protein HAV38_17970 [Glaciimonas immobilis]MBB5201110.1 hypothetical protein [Glaciimonas immobilis]
MNNDEFSLAMNLLTRPQRDRMRAAAEALLASYVDLSSNRSHLLAEILDDSTPRQWAHYPEDDVVDHTSGYQFFYHSHSPDDRDPAIEHGHFHVFARLDVHGHTIGLGTEEAFLSDLNAEPLAEARTISLLCVSLSAKGLPNALFSVNRWVTGDHLLSAATTLRLIPGFTVQVAHYRRVSNWLAALLALFWPQIEHLLIERDRVLLGLGAGRIDTGLLEDESVEVLSSVPIDIDQQIAWLFDDAR